MGTGTVGTGYLLGDRGDRLSIENPPDVGVEGHGGTQHVGAFRNLKSRSKSLQAGNVISWKSEREDCDPVHETPVSARLSGSLMKSGCSLWPERIEGGRVIM